MWKKNTIWRRLAVLAAVLGAAIPVAAADQSELIRNVIQDFKAMPGYVVRAGENEFLIDLDASHGVKRGDLFTVLATGEEVVHPVTGKVLGTLREQKALLKVVRTAEGFSFAGAVRRTAPIKAGDPICRYEHLSARFEDHTKNGYGIYRQLADGLPNLKWLPYERIQESTAPAGDAGRQSEDRLDFVWTGRGLEIRWAPSETIKFYAAADSATAVERAQTPPGGAAKPETPLHPQFAVEPHYKTAGTFAALAHPVVMADFIPAASGLLMAATDGKQLGVYQIADAVPSAIAEPLKARGQVLAVKWWRPDGQPDLFLAVTRWRDHRAVASLYRFRNGKLAPFEDNIPGILGSFDMDADRQPETLLKQQFDEEGFFRSKIRECRLAGDALKTMPPSMALPLEFIVLGSLFADLTGDGSLETATIRFGRLHIYSGKNLIYTSPKQIGGSLSFLTYEIDPHSKYPQTTTAAFEVTPQAVDLDGDGVSEVVASASERDLLGTVGIAPGVKNSWLAVVKHQRDHFVFGTLGEKTSDAIQGIGVNGQKVVFVTSRPGASRREQSPSRLHAYPFR